MLIDNWATIALMNTFFFELTLSWKLARGTQNGTVALYNDRWELGHMMQSVSFSPIMLNLLNHFSYHWINLCCKQYLDLLTFWFFNSLGKRKQKQDVKKDNHLIVSFSWPSSSSMINFGGELKTYFTLTEGNWSFSSSIKPTISG